MSHGQNVVAESNMGHQDVVSALSFLRFVCSRCLVCLTAEQSEFND